MTETHRTADVITDFWQWYERKQRRDRGALAGYALDRREEALRQGEWERFGYWFTVYCRNRSKRTRSN